MSVRAGVVVTGTEVLTGRVADGNGPFVAERLLELGVDLAHVTLCGDRPRDLTAQLEFLAADGVDLIVTTGGLGPTADDLTVATVAAFCGRELVLDEALEARIAALVAPLMARYPDADPDTVRAGTRKQALVPEGASVVEPVGTAPGVVVPGRPTVMVLPGPPRELASMWPAAVACEDVQTAIAGRVPLLTRTVRMFGTTESELAATLREAQQRIEGFDALEITTCLRRGELEVVTRFDPDRVGVYDALRAALAGRHGDTVFSDDGATVDEQVAGLLAGRRVATAESCTGGLIAARLTELAGSSAYVAGGAVAYANEIKVGVLGVDPALIEAHGAVSEPVAAAMAEGARRLFDVDVAVAVTGVAGPGGGTPDKPVGTVWFAVAATGSPPHTVGVRLPGGRRDVRDRSTTVAMHLLRRVLFSAHGAGGSPR